jgi:hypothetical protein
LKETAPVQTAEEAARAIVAARLISADRVKAIWSSLGAERPADALGFVKILVQRGLLDKAQAQQLFRPQPASMPAPLRPPEVRVEAPTTSRDDYTVAPAGEDRAVPDVTSISLPPTMSETDVAFPTVNAPPTRVRTAAHDHTAAPEAHQPDRVLWIGLTAIGLATTAGAWFLLSGSGIPSVPSPPVVQKELPPHREVALAPQAPPPLMIATTPEQVSSKPSSISAATPAATPDRAASAQPVAATPPVLAPPVVASPVAMPPIATPRVAPPPQSQSTAQVSAPVAAVATTTASVAAPFTSRRLPPAVDMRVVALGKSSDWGQGRGYGGLLGREIARQAFLVAARERFGLATRDYWLDENTSEAKATLQFDLIGTGYDESFLELLEGAEPRQESLRSWSMPVVDRTKFDLAVFTTNCERLARTDFAELLAERTGRPAANLAAQGIGPLPQEIETALGQVDTVTVFLALRKLHSADGAKLGSTTKWAGLARGYALLGLLTEYHWHPLSRVFKARALVYGQTLVALAPDDRAALEHRGFAYALAGLHAPALADFKQASEAAAASGAKLSGWAAAADAHCRYDVPALEAVREGEAQYPLANLLRVVTHELSPGRKTVKDSVKAPLTKRALAASHEAAERFPECSRVVQGMQSRKLMEYELPSDPPPVAPLRTSLYTVLPRTADLPEVVKTALADLKQEEPTLGSVAEMATRAKLIEALLDDTLRQVEQSRGDELSWRVLAKLLLEESFLESLPYTWGEVLPIADPNDKARAPRDSIAAVLKHHPYRDFALGGTGDEPHDRKIVEGFYKSIDREAAEDKDARLAFSTYRVSEATASAISSARIHHFENTVVDFFLRDMHSWLNKAEMHELLQLSPCSPIARAYLCEVDWEKVAQFAPEWEREATAQPVLLTALGIAHIRAKRLDEAERCLAAAVKLESDIRSRLALADVYKQRGDSDKWAAAIEELAKETPEEADKLRAAVAGYYLQRRDLQRARPLAEAAAAGHDYGAMTIAYHVHEVLQDWRNSEFWVEQIAEMHPEYAYEWFMWCKRTGQGDLSRAKAATMKWLETGRRNQTSAMIYQQWDLVGVVGLLADDQKTARHFFELLLERSHDTFGGLHAALLAEEQKDTKRRDELLKQIFETPKSAYARRRPKRMELRAVAQWMIDDLAAGGKGETSRETVDKAILGCTPLEATHCYYLLGEYLERRDKKKEAADYWTRCMLLPPLSGISRTLAGAGLTELGIKPETYRERLQRPPRPAQATK